MLVGEFFFMHTGVPGTFITGSYRNGKRIWLSFFLTDCLVFVFCLCIIPPILWLEHILKYSTS